MPWAFVCTRICWRPKRANMPMQQFEPGAGTAVGELKVSVVIPTHNRERLIGRALRSALCQIRPEDEILIIDDGSTDGTEQVVRQFRDCRIRYIWQKNAGAGAARNRGATEATGELLAYLDSDDEWLPSKITLQRRFMTAR